jgi:hypothetical protein
MRNCRLSAFPVPGRVGSRWVLALTLLVPGCSTAQIDSVPQELGGLPAGAPARPGEAVPFPAVHDMPPQRTTSLLDTEQQKRLEADLIRLRNRQPNQQKNIAREKAKAEKAARAKANKENKIKSGGDKKKKKVRKPRTQPPDGQFSAAPTASGTPSTGTPVSGAPPSGTPPWPLPPQTTGGSPRP